MKSLLLHCIFLAVAITGSTGCKYVKTSQAINPPSSSLLKWDKDTRENLFTGAELCHTAYGSHLDEKDGGKYYEKALDEFTRRGIDATYFAIKRLNGIYPELYFLSVPQSDAVTVLFVGTNDDYDWFQNLKVSNFEDVARDGEFYIFPGHAGFRSGLLQILKKGLIDELKNHVKNYNVRSACDTKIAITLLGHSQGAGLVQLSLTIFDGLVYRGKELVTKPGHHFHVARAYAYAAPYAVSTTVKEDSGVHQWDEIDQRYPDKLITVLRDHDLAGVAYNVITYKNQIPSRHFGQFVRINRDGDVFFEDTRWEREEPHSIANYAKALKPHSE